MNFSTGAFSPTLNIGRPAINPKETQMDTKIAIAPKSAPRNLNGSGRGNLLTDLAA